MIFVLISGQDLKKERKIVPVRKRIIRTECILNNETLQFNPQTAEITVFSHLNINIEGTNEVLKHQIGR